MTTDYDLIVVGEGFAGLTCAAQAAKAGLRVATFEAEFLGGLVVNVNGLQQFDEGDGLSGMDFAAILARDNGKAGVKSRNEAVTAVRAVDGRFEVATDAGRFTARYVVLATGAHVRKLGVPGEEEFAGRGVSHCADCDGPMFTDGEVVVVGGGDWALQDAMVLAADASTIHIVHEGAAPTASVESLARVQAESKIVLHANTSVTDVVGDASGVTAVRVRNADGATREIPCTGVFAVPGLEPNSAIAPADVARDAQGHLRVSDDLETAVPGLFAIGQVRAGFGGWLRDATKDARHAAQVLVRRHRAG